MAIVKNIEIIAFAMVENGVTEECHTFQGWLKRGRTVRKGEKSVFSASIWNHATRKDDTTYYYLKNSHFFTLSQTEERKHEPNRKRGANVSRCNVAIENQQKNAKRATS